MGDIPKPDNLPHTVAISAGQYFSIALLRDGAPHMTLEPRDQTVTLGSPAKFAAKAVGSDSMNYQWQFNGTSIPGATGDALVVNEAQPSNEGVYTLEVSNAIGVSSSRKAKLMLARATLPNQPPVLSEQLARVVAEGSELVVSNAAVDADLPAQNLTYQLLEAPAEMAIDAEGTIRWTPTEAQGPGTNVISTMVTDDGTPALSATNTFTVVVEEVNRAPVLAEQLMRVVSEGSELVVSNAAVNADLPAQNLTYQLLEAPAEMAIDAEGTIRWTPTEAQAPGTNVISTMVTDDGTPALSSTNTFTVVVEEVNRAPVLAEQLTRVVSEGAELMVSNAAVDADLPPQNLSYQLLEAPAGMAIDAQGTIRWTPTEAQGPSTNVISTVVTDDGTPALSATNFLTVVVSAPSLASIEDFMVSPGGTVTFTNRANDNDPTRRLTFSLGAAPQDAQISPETGVFNWRTPVAAAGTTNRIEVRVTADSTPPVSDVKGFAVIVRPLEPVLLNGFLFTGREVRFEVSGPIGPDYLIQASADLKDWQTLETSTPNLVPFPFVETNSVGNTASCRFYRIQLRP